jgi:ribonuclease HI
MIEENALNIYTDGSQFSHPRRGGYAIRIIYSDEIGNEFPEDIIINESCPGATNNQMELLACVRALEEAEKSQYYEKIFKIFIFTDSMYVCNNYKTAIFFWASNKWMTRNGNPVANADIWKNLIKLIKKSKKYIEIRWVRGHSKNIHNRAVDKMAKKSAKSPIKAKPLDIVNVRRKHTNQNTDIGSVQMKGQRLKIRIITDQYLKIQKLYRYRYEVTSQNSMFYKMVDIIYSNLLLKAGHEYLVTFNKNTKSPRLNRVIKEIEKT